MRIYITDKNEVREITLRVWSNQRNDGWSPDLFGDLAYNIPTHYPAAGHDTDAEAAMTEQEYNAIVAYWQSEIEDYNNRTRFNWFVQNLSDEEIDVEYAKDLEYSLDF